MNVIMISLDKSLLEADYSGDALERHREYAERAGHLDIIVFSKRGFRKIEVSPHLTVYPTNSFSKLCYVRDAVKIASVILNPPSAGEESRRITAGQNNGDGCFLRDSSPSQIFASQKFGRAQNDNIVVAQDPFLTGWAGWRIRKQFGVPLLLHFHGDFWDNSSWLWERWFNPFLLLISRFLVKRADGIRVVSAGIREKLIKKGIDRSKIRVIPTPVDIDKFEKYDAERVKTIKEKYLQGRKLIINVGNKSLAKDYPALLKTIDLVCRKYDGRLAFWQIGADLDLGEIIKEDKQKRLMAISSGKVSQENLVNYYQAADVYLSSSRHESFGKVLVEAMAAGLPVVATATTGSKEIVIDNENGFLAPIGDAEGLAKRVLYLLERSATAKAMGQRGREIIKDRFNKKEIIDKIINFWRELVISNR